MSITTVQAKSSEELSSMSARLVAAQIQRDLHERGVCVLGVAGGRSVPGVLAALRPLLHLCKGELHVVWIDERVPSEKNFADVAEILHSLRSTALHVFAHPLKTTTREDIAKEATRVLATIARVRGEAKLDLVVASAGEDGHVASLFPRHAALKSTGRAYAIVEGAPKPPATRITMTPELLTTARWGLLIFAGGEKRVAYTHFLDTSVLTKECPAKFLLQLPELVVATALGR